jgi:hypothetical protein
VRAAGLLVCAVAVAQIATPAYSSTTSECHEKFNAAKAAGTLNGMKWADFKKAQCASAAPAAQKPVTDTAANTKPSLVPKSTAVFPSSVSSKYASEAAGRARMHTCRDQYEANKTANTNGGLRWIQKGGGYYSECNKRLKG